MLGWQHCSSKYWKFSTMALKHRYPVRSHEPHTSKSMITHPYYDLYYRHLSRPVQCKCMENGMTCNNVRSRSRTSHYYISRYMYIQTEMPVTEILFFWLWFYSGSNWQFLLILVTLLPLAIFNYPSSIQLPVPKTCYLPWSSWSRFWSTSQVQYYTQY